MLPESSTVLSGRRILVVGGGGFIGRHVVAHLGAAGAEVAVMDIQPPDESLARLDWITGSLTDTALFSSAASGADIVVFLANSSLPGSANTDLSSEIGLHVQVTVKAAEICHAQGVRRFVFASSGGTVYGLDSRQALAEDSRTEPRNAYGVSKLAIEHYLRILTQSAGLQTVSLRISNPYGEGQRAHRQQGFVAAAMSHALEGKTLPIWGDGTVERDFIHIADVARAFVAACAAGDTPAAINIGSGRATSLLEMLGRIEKVLDQPVRIALMPGRRIDVQRNVLDIGRARETLGWTPEVGLDEGLARTAAWWRKLRS